MNKSIFLIFASLFLISFALCMYGGESYYYDLSDNIENLKNFTCNITGENYDLEGLNFSVNDTGFIIDSQVNFKPDNLTVSCLLNGVHYTQESGSPSSVTISQMKLQDGYEQNLREGKKLSFRLGTRSHTFTLKNIYKTYARFSMKSEEQIFNLSVGECKIIELEEFIEVCLLSLDRKDAGISIKSVNITNKVTNETNYTVGEWANWEKVVVENNDIPEEETNYNKRVILLMVLAGLGVLVLICSLVIRKKLKNNEKEVYNNE
jgi:hypothetical protein